VESKIAMAGGGVHFFRSGQIKFYGGGSGL